MGIIQAMEDLDESLQITQVLNEDKANEVLPEHDQLYLNKAKEVKEAEAAEAEAPPEETPGEETPAPADTETNTEEAPESEEAKDGDVDADAETDDAAPDMQVINGKQTTVATESLRTEDYYSRFAVESFGEESLLQKAGGLAWSGVKALSGYALHIATELAGCLKDLGIEYGPRVFAKLRSGVSYLLARALRSFTKMRSAVTRAHFQHTNSFKKHAIRLKRLQQILNDLPDGVKVMQDEPFMDQDVFDLFQVGTQVSPKMSMASVERLLDVVVNDIDQGIYNEINVMKKVIEVCKRNVRVEVIHYLQITSLSSGFMKRRVTGYDAAPDHVDTFVFSQPLPKNTLLMTGLPKSDVVSAAVRSGELSEISKAYQESFMVLGIDPIKVKTSPMVNYMDKKSLLSLLDGLESIVDKAATHVSFYKKLEDAAAQLKPSFQNYFSWLTEDANAKSLRDSLVEVIYLKQSFVTKVYLPGAIDIHDYVSSYVSGMLRYVENNIKVLKPAEPESAV